MVILKDGKPYKKDGYLKDKKGMLQIPLIMFKRNSINHEMTLWHLQ